LGNGRGQPLLKHLINKRVAALGGQPPRSFLSCYGELRSAQQVDGQRCGLRSGPAGPTLMIIEGCQQELIMRIGRGESQSSGDGEAEESGHPVVDHPAADGLDLLGCQDVQQC